MTRPSLNRNDALRSGSERMIVRHENHCRLGLAVERLEQLDDVRAGIAIEVAGWLVGEKNSR
jgi:hypothetical protein